MTVFSEPVGNFPRWPTDNPWSPFVLIGWLCCLASAMVVLAGLWLVL